MVYCFSGKYYFGISGWEPLSLGLDVTTPAIGVMEYNGSSPSATPVMPNFPDVGPETSMLGYPFFENLFSLKDVNLPHKVDRELEFATAIASIECTDAEMCFNTFVLGNGSKFGSTINNVTFDIPTNNSILQAYFFDIPGVYTTDFPPVPPLFLNFTQDSLVFPYMRTAERGAKTLVLKYNQTVQIVLQDLNVFFLDYHPFHLHGHNFYVIGTGFGNFNASIDPQNFNLKDPPSRYTVGVPAGGWVAIRFIANNPGKFQALGFCENSVMHSLACHAHVGVTYVRKHSS